MELSTLEHQLSGDSYRLRYYCMMVPSIVISSFLAILSVFFTSGDEESELQYKIISGCMNGFNTVLMGINGLLQYQSQASMHTNSSSQCNALMFEVEEMETQLRTLVQGIQTEDSVKEMTECLRKFNTRLEQVLSKHQEIGEMAPVRPWATLKALDKIKQLESKKHELGKFRSELNYDAIGPNMLTQPRVGKRVVPEEVASIKEIAKILDQPLQVPDDGERREATELE